MMHPYAGISSATVGGAVGGVIIILLIVLVCGFGIGVMAVYALRWRKRIKQSTVITFTRAVHNCVNIMAHLAMGQ